MKQLKNNKGVAFVTVLISITFITILSVSLLYMAYLNYLTKSLRTRGNNNFYTCEFAVDEVAAKLQQTAANVKKSGGGISDAKDAIANAVGVSAGKYNPTNVQSLINVSNSDGTVITVETDPATADYVSNSNSVILRNLKFKSVDPSGYESTIITDMKIQFQTTPPGDYDINDFSIISDSIINTESTGTAYSCFAGCMYLQDRDGVGYALNNSGGGLISILSPIAIIDGNVHVGKSGSNGSALSIAGSVIVTGNVTVDSDCTLAVSGSLNVKGKVTNNGHIIGSDHITENASVTLPDEGLASAVLAKHVYLFESPNVSSGKYKNDEGNQYIINCRIIDYADLKTKGLYTPNADQHGTYKVKNNADVVIAENVYPVMYLMKDNARSIAISDVKCNYDSTKTYKAYMSMPGDCINGIDVSGGMDSQKANGSLVFDDGTLKMVGMIRETTVITTGKVSSSSNADASMTRMSDEGYEAAKNCLVVARNGDSGYDATKTSTDTSTMQMPGGGGKSLTFMGGTFETFCDAMCSGDYIVFSYNANSGDIDKKPLIGTETTAEAKKAAIAKMTKMVYDTNDKGEVLDVDGNVWKSTSGKAKKTLISVDDETRFLVFTTGDTTKNAKWTALDYGTPDGVSVMIPYGYFIAPESSKIVSKYVSAGSSAEDPQITTVSFTNWFKE